MVVHESSRTVKLLSAISVRALAGSSTGSSYFSPFSLIIQRCTHGLRRGEILKAQLSWCGVKYNVLCGIWTLVLREERYRPLQMVWCALGNYIRETFNHSFTEILYSFIYMYNTYKTENQEEDEEEIIRRRFVCPDKIQHRLGLSAW